MKYRGIPYERIQVKDYKGVEAIMYRCSDKKLLEHVEVTSFTKFTEKRMREAIDDYIENVDYYKELKKLNYKAALDFYGSK
jgi:benzoyl-CoA reductase/2-hydroxyglutaryl-CoA dehydratase subunit BcrC/BadD/HgdB